MHSLEDFKGFKKGEVNLFRPLTVLIGPNGSGKSNVIEGIELLSFIARGRFLHEVVELGRGGDGLEIRGGIKACPRFGHSIFSLGFSARAKFDGNRRPFNYRVSVQVQPTPRIVDESLTIGDENEILIFKTSEPSANNISGDIWVTYNNFDRGRNKPQIAVGANRSVLSQYKNFAEKNKEKSSCEHLVETISTHLRASFVFDPKPSLMRKYEKAGDVILQRNGSNLSSVLYSLRKPPVFEALFNPNEIKTENEKTEKLERLRKWICSLPEEQFSDFDFVATQLNDVIFGLRSASGNLVDASLLSDGTLRSLAFLTALETVEEGSRVIMEEFDNGVHPSRIDILTKALAECSARRKLNVLVTTHNPATLNALHGDQLDGVIFSVWDKSESAYRLVKLSDLPRLPEFLESGRLGDLVTRRVVEEYLSKDVDEERRKSVAGWLSRLP